MRQATAFWVDDPGSGALRTEELAAPAPGEVLVRTLHTGISRGTESVVFRAKCPPQSASACAPPSSPATSPRRSSTATSTSVSSMGPAELVGRTVFTLLPAPVGVRRARLGGRGRARRRARAQSRAGGRRRDGGEHPVGCRAPRRRPGHCGRRGNDRVLRRRDCCAASRASTSCCRRRPREGEVAERLGVAFASPADRSARARHRHRHERLGGGPPASRSTPRRSRARSSRPAGSAIAPCGSSWAAGSTRAGSRSARVRSAWSRPRAARPGTSADRLGLALELLRDSAFDALLDRRVVVARPARGDGRGRGRIVAGLCHTIDWSDAA